MSVSEPEFTTAGDLPPYEPLARLSGRAVLIGLPDGGAAIWVRAGRWRRAERCANCGRAARRYYRPAVLSPVLGPLRLCTACVAVDDWPIVRAHGSYPVRRRKPARNAPRA